MFIFLFIQSLYVFLYEALWCKMSIKHSSIKKVVLSLCSLDMEEPLFCWRLQKLPQPFPHRMQNLLFSPQWSFDRWEWPYYPWEHCGWHMCHLESLHFLYCFHLMCGSKWYRTRKWAVDLCMDVTPRLHCSINVYHMCICSHSLLLPSPRTQEEKVLLNVYVCVPHYYLIPASCSVRIASLVMCCQSILGRRTKIKIIYPISESLLHCFIDKGVGFRVEESHSDIIGYCHCSRLSVAHILQIG